MWRGQGATWGGPVMAALILRYFRDEVLAIDGPLLRALICFDDEVELEEFVLPLSAFVQPEGVRVGLEFAGYRARDDAGTELRAWSRDARIRGALPSALRAAEPAQASSIERPTAASSSWAWRRSVAARAGSRSARWRERAA